MTDRATTQRIRDPFTGRDVDLADDILDRLRGRYGCGPIMENGEPEMGWRQHRQVPIQLDAADRIERLEGALAALAGLLGKAEMAPPADAAGKGPSELAIRLADPAEAADLHRMLRIVASGLGATLGPDPKPRGPLLGWDTEGDDA